MKQKLPIIIGILLVIAVLLFWRLGSPDQVSVLSAQPNSESKPLAAKSDEGGMNAQPNGEQKKKTIEQIEARFATPITFFGRVVDQNHAVVAHPHVAYSLADGFAASGSIGQVTGGADGNFEIAGVRGAVLGVSVSKKGYYVIRNSSNQRFAYGLGADGDTKPPPSKHNPAVFVLHKMGNPVPLIQITSRQFEVPESDDPVTIDLRTGKAGQSGLHVRSQIGHTIGNRFDWAFEISAPGGGLVERKDPFQFEAPIDGYQERITIDMQASNPSWKMTAEGDFFVRLQNGEYARINVRFYPRRHRNMIVLESYLNPNMGDRNLEHDNRPAAAPSS